MKRFFMCLMLICAAVPAHGAEKPKKYLELGVAPVEPGRMVNWGAGECILRLEHDELATITYARGGISSGWLRRGTAVVVDREGIARWVYNCGNTVVEPQKWKPRGKLECGPSLRADAGGGEHSTGEPAYLPKEENGGKWYLLDSEKPKATAKALKRKDPNKKWYFVAAGILALGAAGAYCTSSPDCIGNGGIGGGSGNPPNSGGGPAPDPPN